MSFYNQVRSITRGIFSSKKRNTVNASRSRFKPSPFSRKNKTPFFIASGATGIVFRNRTDPKKVFKVFTRKVNANNEYNTANLVVKYTKNNKQKVQNVKGFTFGNLSQNVQNALREKSPNYYYFNNSQEAKNAIDNKILSVIRMENLGIDLITFIAKDENFNQLSKIPNIVPILLAQFYKLIYQVEQLHDHNLYHCDIRMENIMIDIETGILTLIDFDRLGPEEYCTANLKSISTARLSSRQRFTTTWPIEWLVIGNEILRSKVSNDHPAALSNDELIMLNKTRIMLDIFGISYDVKDIQDAVNFQIVQDEMNTQSYFQVYLHSVLNRITPIIQHGGLSPSQLTSGFDTFGLGIALSYFLYKLQDNNIFQTIMDDHDNELLDVAFVITKKMCAFDITRRTPIREAVLGMRHFLQMNGIPLPVSGGRRRQTRRR